MPRWLILSVSGPTVSTYYNPNNNYMSCLVIIINQLVLVHREFAIEMGGHAAQVDSTANTVLSIDIKPKLSFSTFRSSKVL